MAKLKGYCQYCGHFYGVSQSTFRSVGESDGVIQAQCTRCDGIEFLSARRSVKKSIPRLRGRGTGGSARKEAAEVASGNESAGWGTEPVTIDSRLLGRAAPTPDLGDESVNDGPPNLPDGLLPGTADIPVGPPPIPEGALAGYGDAGTDSDLPPDVPAHLLDGIRASDGGAGLGEASRGGTDAAATPVEGVSIDDGGQVPWAVPGKDSPEAPPDVIHEGRVVRTGAGDQDSAHQLEMPSGQLDPDFDPDENTSQMTVHGIDSTVTNEPSGAVRTHESRVYGPGSTSTYDRVDRPDGTSHKKMTSQETSEGQTYRERWEIKSSRHGPEERDRVERESSVSSNTGPAAGDAPPDDVD